MKKFMQEFKEFAFRGNVMSLAVGLIIGAAFQDIVTSLTDNILSPLIGLLVGQDFGYLEWQVLGVSLRYGAFINSIIRFLILALVVFWIVRTMNKLVAKKESEEADAELTRQCTFCMTEINQEAIRCPACTSILDLAEER